MGRVLLIAAFIAIGLSGCGSDSGGNPADSMEKEFKGIQASAQPPVSDGKAVPPGRRGAVAAPPQGQTPANSSPGSATPTH